MGPMRKLPRRPGKAPARPSPTLAAKLQSRLAGGSTSTPPSGKMAFDPSLAGDLNTVDDVDVVEHVDELGQPPNTPTPFSPSSINNAHQLLDKMPHPPTSPINASPKPHNSSPSSTAPLGSKATTNAAHSSPKQQAPWANLFKENHSFHVGDKLSLIEHAKTECIIPQSALNDVHDAWGPTLVGYVAGKFPGKQAIQACSDSWTKKCLFSIHASGWLIFRFQSIGDMDTVLEGGPYFIFGRPLLLKVLPPLFTFENDEICQVPVWVRLPSLPIELWNPLCFNHILSSVGTPIRTDKLTATFKRNSFARALVNVDVSKDLVREVPIHLPHDQLIVQPIHYETIPPFCKKCKILGHLASSCKSSPPKPPSPPTHSAMPPSAAPNSDNSAPLLPTPAMPPLLRRGGAQPAARIFRLVSSAASRRPQPLAQPSANNIDPMLQEALCHPPAPFHSKTPEPPAAPVQPAPAPALPLVSSDPLNRLLYRSKQRGYLELDLVLGKWVADHIHFLDEVGIKALVHVLDLENPDLWSWLTGQEQPPEAVSVNPVFAAVREKVMKNLNNHSSPETRATPGQPWVRGWDDIKKGRDSPITGNQ